MIAFAILAALAEQSPRPVSYPSGAVLVAFGQTCENIKYLKGAEAKARLAGWARLRPEDRSPILQLLQRGFAEGEKMVKARGGSITPLVALRKQVAGEDLVAVFSGVRVEGVVINVCSVSDAWETRRITPEEGQRWMKRAPSANASTKSSSSSTWKPGYAPGHSSFSIQTLHVPAAGGSAGLNGIILKAELVGADK